MSKSTATVQTVTVETPVGPRTITEGQPWWKGNGRGYTREFIPVEGEHTCRRCEESLPETAFPTFTVPRKDGRTRGDVCRACTREVREENAKKAKRRAAAAKARAAKAAKAQARKEAAAAAA